MVLATMVPLLVLALVLAWLGYRAEREREAAATLGIARSILIGVDLEVERSIAGLSALAESRSLCLGDLETFRQQLVRFVADQHPGANALLSMRNGQQLINLLASPGQPLPVRRNLEPLERMFGAGKPVVSDLYEGTFQPRVISIEVPVRCGNEIHFNLALVPRLARYTELLERQRVPETWTVVLMDQRGEAIAEHGAHASRLGVDTLVSGNRLDLNSDQGVVLLPMASGDADVFSYSRSPATGWTVMIQRPYQELRSEFTVRMLQLMLGGAVLVGLAIVSALLVSRSILRPVSSLGRMAAQNDPGDAHEPSGIVEFDTVAGALRHAMLELRQADRNKDEFVATLAHELRSPVSGIKNALSVVRFKESLHAPGERAVQIAERQLHQIERLIQDLLDISRIRHAKTTLDLQPLDLRDALRDAADSKASVLEERSQRFQFELPPDPLPIQGDLVRLTQVFSNLLDNASKYTPEGGQVCLDVQPDDNGWCVTVSDSGQGLEPSRVNQIFDMFWQMPGPDGRSTQSGLGIGLSLVKRLVEMHGGRVWARSQGIGYGSRFSVWIPGRLGA